MNSSSNRNNRSKKAKKPLIDPEEMKPLIKKLSRSGKFANLFLKSYVSYPQTISCAPLIKPKCSETNKKKQKKNSASTISNANTPAMPNSFQAKGNAGKPSMDLAKRNSNLILNPIHNGIYNMSSNKQYFNFNKKSRVPFTAEEDEKIKKLAEKYGTKQWSLISSFVKGRTPKQCRDRYCNYLFPGYFKGEWTKEEDELLEKLYIENGPKWSIIQKSFPERSPNSVKNRWNYFLCRQKNKTKKKEDNDLDDVNFELQNEFDLNEGDNELQTFSVFSQNDDFFNSQNDDLFGHPLVQNKVDMNIKNDENNEIEKTNNFIKRENEFFSPDHLKIENDTNKDS